MVWTADDITNLILVAKDVGIKHTEYLCRKMDLGQSIDRDIEYLYLMCNIIFALENSSTDVYEDIDYSLLSEMVNRVEVRRRRKWYTI
jgi:macrodomain Ter protein organizer (MatP/YcbG family)